MDLKEVIDFAEELGERFPDMTNSEIILACEEFAGKSISGYYARIVLVTAYDSGKDAAIKEARKYNML